MAYQIQYSTKNVGSINRKNIRRNNGRRFVATLLFLTIFLAAVFTNLPRYLADYIIPGDTRITVRAVRAFAEDIRAGESVKDSVVAFCREILLSGTK